MTFSTLVHWFLFRTLIDIQNVALIPINNIYDFVCNWVQKNPIKGSADFVGFL